MTETESHRIEKFREWYTDNRERYVQAANYVHEKINKYIEEQKFNVVSSSARAKAIDSAYEKAKKMEEKDGRYVLKYADPQNEITDFAAVRFVVYLLSDMQIITDAVERLFAGSIIDKDSENKKALLGDDRVGYLSIHYVMTIDTTEQQYKNINGIKCEIQIRTMLQDAWAQIFHDRLYKGSIDDIEKDGVKRKTNLLSGSLELIDSQIDELVKYYDSKNGTLGKKAYQALLNEEIVEETLRKYCVILSKGKVEKYFSYSHVKTLLSAFQISTIRELDYCVREDFIRELEDMGCTLTIDRLVHYILFLSNPKMFCDVTNGSTSFVIERPIYELLSRFVDMEDICTRYKHLKIYGEGKENE